VEPERGCGSMATKRASDAAPFIARLMLKERMHVDVVEMQIGTGPGRFLLRSRYA
jgi:hypothetical protein